MLKIVVNAEGDAMVLHLEGQVIGPWVAELERVSAPLLARGGGVRFDLGAVSFVGREGAALLARLGDDGARLVNCSRFVAEQIKGAPSQPIEEGRA